MEIASGGATVEITSGGTTGPELDTTFQDRDNNAYGSVLGETTPQSLARMFVNDGWRARKSSWTEFEVEHEWAQLELFPYREDGGLTFAGFVDPVRVDELAALLRRFGLRGSIELYGDDQTLLRELTY